MYDLLFVFFSPPGSMTSTMGVGLTKGDLENCEWMEGEDVTSGLNFCGELGGVATAMYGFAFFPFAALSFLQLKHKIEPCMLERYRVKI